jgi:hypothetical protein
VPVAIERQRELLSDVTPDEMRAFSDLIDRMQSNVADGGPVSDELRRKRPHPPAPQVCLAPLRSPGRQAAAPRG